MCRFILTVVFILVAANSSIGYKWISRKPGDAIPKGAAVFHYNPLVYVGRARHYDLLLPAEIYNSSHVSISTCSRTIRKPRFEIFIMNEHCVWLEVGEAKDWPLNSVRVGNVQNGEPIFVGRRMNDNKIYHLSSVLLTSNKTLDWVNQRGTQYYLSCEDNNEWVDAKADDIPKDAISGGESDDGHKIYVARLLSDCDTYPGQVIPSLGIASAVSPGKDMLFHEYCQVLVGDSNKYSWVHASGGEIPDYAVVGGKYESELMYVARMNKTLGFVTYKEASENNMSYEILIKNE